MKTQSAVQWLVEQLTYENDFAARLTSFNGDSNVSEIVEQANAMFEEQIKLAFSIGMNSSVDYFDGVTDEDENYYQQTFNK